ncbi:hypothetical protein MVI01_61780 [Myxococcus virescens]|uniref:Uncharacterized protein n=1 Tax=Myxococcus virescens TaxID=83456 RepID=A0A511HLX7_9BACT|nr:hypothetical protein MVI01_61780 [Myxococcus virescens]
MAELHALRIPRGAGRVLKEGQRVPRGSRTAPPRLGPLRQRVGSHPAERGEFGGAFEEPLPHLLDEGGGEHDARARIPDDGAQPRQRPLQPHRVRRIGWDGDQPGIQAAEETRDVLQARWIEEHRPLTRLRQGLECRANAPGSQIQPGVAQDRVIPAILQERVQRPFTQGLGLRFEELQQCRGRVGAHGERFQGVELWKSRRPSLGGNAQHKL